MPNHNICCEGCGNRVSRMSIRYRKHGDLRPTSRLPQRGVGYFCAKCNKVHSVDPPIEFH